jgi:hypothetical protein
MRLFILLFLALSLAAAPAAAQPFIYADNAAVGELTGADSTLDGGARYDTWRFTAKEWHGYVIFARADFDVRLSAGVQPGGRCGDDCVETTRAQHGTAIVRLDYVPPQGGTYLIRVAAVRAEDRGRYELRLEGYADTLGTPVVTVPDDAGVDVVVSADTTTMVLVPAMDSVMSTSSTIIDTVAMPVIVVPTTDTVMAVATVTMTDTMTGYGSPTLSADTAQVAPTELRAGMMVRGVLDEWDRQGVMDYAYLDLYTYRAHRPGETIVIRMRSAEFDTELRVVHAQAGAWATLGVDDDGGGGTDSELVITFPDPGEYEIHARAHWVQETGRYTLSVERR